MAEDEAINSDQQADAEPTGQDAVPNSGASKGFDSFMQARAAKSENEPAAEVVQPEVVEAEVADEQGDEVEDDGQVDQGGIFDELKGVFAELHISGRQLIFIFGGIGTLIVLIVFSFTYLLGFLGDNTADVDSSSTLIVSETSSVIESQDQGPGLWERITGWFGGGDEPSAVITGSESDSQSEVATDSTSVDEATDLGRDEASPSTEPAQVISQADREIPIFAQTVLLMVSQLGQEQQLDSRLGYFTRTYRQVRNTFNTDLIALLNNANDRKAAYDNYLTGFKAHNAEAIRAYEELRQEVERLDETSTRVSEAKDAAEQSYLVASQNLASEQLPELLAEFQAFAEKEAVIRSELRARQQIQDRYQRGLPLIQQKILAVEANEDAFVKGVQVVDFPQIDLDLVIAP